MGKRKFKLKRRVVSYAIFFIIMVTMNIYANPTSRKGTSNLQKDIENYLTISNFAGTEDGQSPYVVGSILITVKSDNPGTYLGGSWQQLGTGGQCLFGYDQNSTNFNTLGKTGGANTITLNADTTPAHTHSFTVTTNKTSEDGGDHKHQMRWSNSEYNCPTGYDVNVEYFKTSGSDLATAPADGSHKHEYSMEIKGQIKNAGSGAAFSILNPYIVVYMWKKTA